MSTYRQERHIRTAGDIMTNSEAAAFLRLSKSTLYQRKDIPRHRLPGSRQVRFFKDELIAWLKSGALETPSAAEAVDSHVDIGTSTVYHRNARYR